MVWHQLSVYWYLELKHHIYNPWENADPGMQTIYYQSQFEQIIDDQIHEMMVALRIVLYFLTIFERHITITSSLHKRLVSLTTNRAHNKVDSWRRTPDSEMAVRKANEAPSVRYKPTEAEWRIFFLNKYRCWFAITDNTYEMCTYGVLSSLTLRGEYSGFWNIISILRYFLYRPIIS